MKVSLLVVLFLALILSTQAMKIKTETQLRTQTQFLDHIFSLVRGILAHLGIKFRLQTEGRLQVQDMDALQTQLEQLDALQTQLESMRLQLGTETPEEEELEKALEELLAELEKEEQ